MNEIQVVVQEYVGLRKAKKLAQTIVAEMSAETQHIRRGIKFFVNEDENRELVLTMDSMVKKAVEKILCQNLLEEDEVQECLERIIKEHITDKIDRIPESAMDKIQEILYEYTGIRKAKKLTKTIVAEMSTETQHTHRGINFFVNEDGNGELVLTMDSMVKKAVEKILCQNLEEDEVQECLEQIMKVNSTGLEVKTMRIEGSDSKIYSELLKHKPETQNQEEFMDYLKEAIEAKKKSFMMPIYYVLLGERMPPVMEDNIPEEILYKYQWCRNTTYEKQIQIEARLQKKGFRLCSMYEYCLF